MGRSSLHNEEIHGLHRSPNIIKEINSRKLRQSNTPARMEEGMYWGPHGKRRRKGNVEIRGFRQ